jgi:hypothetical protein
MRMLADGTDGLEGRLGYRLFDADNHYCEPEDAFLRHMDRQLAHKAPRWVQMVEGGAKRLVFGDRMNRFVGADHTFSSVGQPGILLQGKGCRPPRPSSWPNGRRPPASTVTRPSCDPPSANPVSRRGSPYVHCPDGRGKAT